MYSIFSNSRYACQTLKNVIEPFPFPRYFPQNRRISRSRSLLLCRVKNKIKERKGKEEKDECGIIIAQIENTYAKRNALTFHSRRPRYSYASPLTPDPLFIPSPMNEPSKISNSRQSPQAMATSSHSARRY